MQIRPSINSPTVLVELTTTNGGIVLDDITKVITLNISATDTAALSFKSAVYSLEMINGVTVTPLLYGNVTLDTEITR